MSEETDLMDIFQTQTHFDLVPVQVPVLSSPEAQALIDEILDEAGNMLPNAPERIIKAFLSLENAIIDKDIAHCFDTGKKRVSFIMKDCFLFL